MQFRIAVIAACPFPYPRGTPVRIQRLSEALAKQGHEVHVVTYHLGEGRADPSVEVHRIPEVQSYRKTGPGPSYKKLAVIDPLLVKKTREVIRERGIDIIHAHHYEGLLVGAFARRKTAIPLVYDAHTLLESELPYYGLGLPRSVKAGLGRWLDRRVPPLSDFVVSVTQVIRDKLVDNRIMPAAKVAVIANGVEREFYEYEKRGLEGDSRVLIFAGNLAAYQGINEMLRAFREVSATRDGVRLAIVTDSSFEEYEPLARELGIRDQIDLVRSELDKLPELLSGGEVALNPRQDCDGIPQKLLNYMAVGIPVVSFKGSAPVVEHRKTGWIVENGNISGFADGILRLLENAELARQIGRNAREYIRQHHTWEGAAARCEQVYEKLVPLAAVEQPDVG